VAATRTIVEFVLRRNVVVVNGIIIAQSFTGDESLGIVNQGDGFIISFEARIGTVEVAISGEVTMGFLRLANWTGREDVCVLHGGEVVAMWLTFASY
jgi:hypothetical protein